MLLKALSGVISDRLRGSSSPSDSGWTPQRPGPPAKTPKPSKNITTQSTPSGRKAKKSK